MAALRAGASGFLLKDAPRDSLYAEVYTVAAGDALLARSVTKRLIEHRLRTCEPPAAPAGPPREADRREREVLTLLARGLSNAEIASCLHMSEPTVRTHVGRAYLKSTARHRAQAVVLAYESGLVQAGHPGPLTRARHASSVRVQTSRSSSANRGPVQPRRASAE